jgi:O-antigen/teichoic acid export membrane protein
MKPSAALTETMTFGGYVTLQRILWFVYSSADVFIVGKVLGKELLGQYAISYHFASLPMQKVNGIISAVTFPAYARARERPGALRSQLSKTIRILSVIAFPVFAGISVVSQDAILVVLGEQWAPAVVSMQLLSLVMPLKMILSSIQTALNSAGRPDITFAIVVVATVLIPGAVVAGGRYGLSGIALAWVVAFPCVFVIAIVLARRTLEFGMRDLCGCIWKPAFASAVMYAVVVAVKFASGFPASPGRLALLIVLGTVTYALGVVVLAREDVAELRILIAP